MFVRSFSFALLSFLLTGLAQAAVYVPAAPEKGKAGLAFAIGYTGNHVHRGDATIALGELQIDPARLEIGAGEIRFPITALDSGNAKRNCHIVESLGLDYAKSVYPEEHVCGGSNVLPTEGPNAVVYPEIRFLFRAIKDGKVTGTFALHGIEKEITVPVTLTAEAGGKVRVKSEFSIHLPDFGVIVKNFLIITVDDDAKISVDLVLEPKK